MKLNFLTSPLPPLRERRGESRVQYCLHYSRKSVFWGRRVLIALLISISLWSASFHTVSTVRAMEFRLQDGLIKLTNAHYEAAFSTTDGSITYITDKATGKSISDGSSDSSLWSAVFNGTSPIFARDMQFKYNWDEAAKKLTLDYTGKVNVTVTVTGSDSNWLKMQAVATNKSGLNVAGLNFPHELQITSADVNDGLIPLMPGALLNSSFFTSRSYTNLYPGVMFADYLAVRSSRGNIAMYSQRDTILRPVILGYERASADSPFTKLVHRFRTWLADGKSVTTPAVIIRIGQDYPTSIAGYRADNGIDKYKSIESKLPNAQAWFAAPMYKLDLAVVKQSFADIKTSLIDKLRVPGMIHFVVVNSGGMDNNYPDFIPPDTKWGSTEAFADLVDYIHKKGSLAVPYTNFSWWDNLGPTIMNLPASLKLLDVIVTGTEGAVAVEKYGPNVGYVMNQHNAFVKQKIAEQHDLFMKTVKVDGIFEDQWGVRNSPYDMNVNGLDKFDAATSYYEGVLEHYRALVGSNLFTEQGVDVLAENGIGFMGTNYLWDMQGFRGATAGVTHYYPIAAMMFRDKVLLYQHDLAAETWTKNKDMLRWNLDQGYSLSNAFYDTAAGFVNPENPWLTLIGVFQKYALASYADELVTSYENPGDGIWRTTFTSTVVTSNWNAEKPYTLDGYTLPPGGVITQAKDKSMTAGVFTGYNGQALSEGDHYLVELRTADSVKIFQPIGADTSITVRFAGSSKAVITAYGYDGAKLGTSDGERAGDSIRFNYQGTVGGQAVAYYQITS